MDAITTPIIVNVLIEIVLVTICYFITYELGHIETLGRHNPFVVRDLLGSLQANTRFLFVYERVMFFWVIIIILVALLLNNVFEWTTDAKIFPVSDL